jgi:YD repeat-containing protein
VYATAINMAGLGATVSAPDLQARVLSVPTQDAVEHRVYDRDGRVAATVVATVDGGGAVVRYTYDANGNVVTRVGHAQSIALASWVPGTVPTLASDPARDSRWSAVYDALNRVTYTLDGVGAVTWQRYDGNGNVLERVAYAAAVATTTSLTAAALSAAVAAVANAQRDARSLNVYDNAGRLTWTAEGTGAVSRFQYDRNGNVVQETRFAALVAPTSSPASVLASASDRVTSRAYDAANRRVFEIGPLNAVVEQVFDADGRVTRSIGYANVLGTVPALGLSSSAAAIRSALQPDAAKDRSTRFGFNAAGQMEIMVGADGAVTQTRYDAAGRAVLRTSYATLVDASALSSTATAAVLRALVGTAAQDRATAYGFDAAGRLTSETDAVQMTRRTYDAAGRLLSSGVEDRIERYRYDAAGHRLETTDANGNTELSSYDALGRLTAFTNKAGSRWTYDYDAGGRRISETTPLFVAREWYQPTPSTWATRSAFKSAVTLLTYDALGNLTQRTEAAGRLREERSTRYEYDAAGRQLRVIFPPVGVYAAARDVPTDVWRSASTARVEDLRSLETRTFYDAFGNAVANLDVGGALSQKVYDRAGGLAYEVDARGFVTGYQRDAFGGVTALTRYANGTSFHTRSVMQASQAVGRTELEQVLNGAGVSHAGSPNPLSTLAALARASWPRLAKGRNTTHSARPSG